MIDPTRYIKFLQNCKSKFSLRIWPFLFAKYERAIIFELSSAWSIIKKYCTSSTNTADPNHDWHGSELVLHRVEQLITRSLPPRSSHGSFGCPIDRPVALGDGGAGAVGTGCDDRLKWVQDVSLAPTCKPPEVIDPRLVIQLHRPPHALTPPIIPLRFVRRPLVQR